DGIIYGVYSFSRKIGQALAGGLGGFALTFIGYDSLAASQTIEVTNGIYSLSTLFPGVCYLIVGLILVFAYPLSKKVVEENSRILNEKRANN
ncbi:MFS transporter, partial [Intestinibacter sp.]|uniref:MFS transporter n=1 Tax=Intestinibacter sp. TaxID=1965304 RepID=UPI003F18AC51